MNNRFDGSDIDEQEDEDDPDDFSKEFSYNLEGKKASFRPRTRPYKPRKKVININNSNAVNINNSSSF